ncbi:MAG: TIGR02281 family clan AA aspartic protease [Cyanobacteria bacterium]|nr:TIGR02281 family clan AA aspartic protease [Cyanobacteriota bacterium]
MTKAALFLVLVIQLLCVQSASAKTFFDYYQNGVMEYRQGSYSQAMSDFQQAFSLSPSNSNVHYYLGLLNDQFNRNHEAVVHYQFVMDHCDETRLVDYAATRVRDIQKTALAGISSPVKTAGVVALKQFSNALLVEATMNEKVAGTFIVDTGATYTSISREMADALGLDLTHAERVPITTANGRIEVPKVMLKTLSVNGVEAHNVEVTVLDLRKGASFSGLLGLSFIKQFRLTIDPQLGQLIFQPL